MTMYEVIGNTKFKGFSPGETFQADLSPEQERRAMQRGAIRKVNKKADNKQEEGNDE